MPELIDRFNWVARPYLGLFAPATCIEQSRILVEVLPEFGAKAEALECSLKVDCPALRLVYIAGATAQDRARGKAKVDDWIDLGTRGDDADQIHVAVAAEIAGQFFLLDPTFSQASMPDRGLTIPRHVLAVGPLSQRPAPGTMIDAGLVLDGGTHIKASWIMRESRDFERTPAWEPSHLWPLIHRLVREMNWAACVEGRRKAG